MVRRAQNGAYVLRDMTGDILDRHVPADQLKLVSRKLRGSDNQKNVYQVEKIVSHRGNDPTNYQYLVKWQGYPDEDNTWQEAKHFLDDQCIREYWSRQSSSSSTS